MIGTKKMLNMYILDILRERTDENHRLMQAEIIQILHRDYEIDCERKAISRNISELMNYGYEIIHDGGYYLAERDFEDSELRLLIDSVYFSPSIPPNQAKALIEKLRNLATPSFGKALSHVTGLCELHDRNTKQFFYTLQTLDEAISAQKKVSLMINAYGIDKELHPKREKKYIVNAYKIVAANGRYYIIGNHDSHDNITHIRVDRISDCEILNEAAKPMQFVKGLEYGLNLANYLKEHMHMRLGGSVFTKFRIHKASIGEAIDWFGKDMNIAADSEKADYVVVSLQVNGDAMVNWAMQYCGMVEVLQPQEVRDKVIKALEVGREIYF